MALFDVGSINRAINGRAARLLDDHVEKLGSLASKFTPENGAYYYEIADGDTMRIGYNPTKKLLTKTFNLEFVHRIESVDFPDDFKGRIKFRGMKEIDAAFFSLAKKNGRIEKILNDPKIIGKILKYARKVDLAYIRLEYIKRNGALTLTVVPYSGAYMWVKIPPVFYGMKLRDDEVRSLYALTKEVGDGLAKLKMS
jgi:hypothetical protein